MIVNVSVQLTPDESIDDADKAAKDVLKALGGTEESSWVQLNIQPAAQSGSVGTNPMAPPMPMPPPMP